MGVGLISSAEGRLRAHKVALAYRGKPADFPFLRETSGPFAGGHPEDRWLVKTDTMKPVANYHRMGNMMF